MDLHFAFFFSLLVYVSTRSNDCSFEMYNLNYVTQTTTRNKEKKFYWKQQLDPY